jgi:kynurenine formamidase
MSELSELLGRASVYELAQTYFTGMPHFPTHPPFLYSLTRQHGEQVGPQGHSSSADAIAMGSHVGTHIDALCHFSRDGRLFGGEPVVQSYSDGMGRHAADGIGPILRRAVLLDIAGLLKMAALPRDFEITPEHLDAAAEGVEIQAGDIVLLRTGWAAYWREPARFLSQGHSPGPSAAGACWLSKRGLFAAGSDTLTFEKVPAETMPVHVHLLVECGIHIIECLNLEELAAAGIRSFAFVAAPLKIRGATGAPLQPLGLVDTSQATRSPGPPEM